MNTLLLLLIGIKPKPALRNSTAEREQAVLGDRNVRTVPVGDDEEEEFVIARYITLDIICRVIEASNILLAK